MEKTLSQSPMKTKEEEHTEVESSGERERTLPITGNKLSPPPSLTSSPSQSALQNPLFSLNQLSAAGTTHSQPSPQNLNQRSSSMSSLPQGTASSPSRPSSSSQSSLPKNSNPPPSDQVSVDPPRAPSPPSSLSSSPSQSAGTTHSQPSSSISTLPLTSLPQGTASSPSPPSSSSQPLHLTDPQPQSSAAGTTPSQPSSSISTLPLLSRQPLTAPIGTTRSQPYWSTVTSLPQDTALPQRNPAEIEKWRKLVKRCHEVILLLIGFAVVFVPISLVMQSVSGSDYVGDSVSAAIMKLIFSFLQDFEASLVAPFFTAAVLYGLTYTMSAADVPVLFALCLDMIAVFVGFAAGFILIYHIWQIFAIAAGVICEIVVAVLFACQFPRERAAVNNLGTP